MEFNMQNAYNCICKVVSSHLSITEGMKELLNYCRSNFESHAWDNIQNMNFEYDKVDLVEWLNHNLTSETPDEELDAFWLGLFDGVCDDEEVCMLYLSGITCGDDESEELDFEPIYLPDDRYIELEILQNISTILKGEGGKVLEIGEYVLYLGYVGLVIRDIMKDMDKKLLLGEKHSRKIMVGFDSGDYIILESIKR